MIETFVKRPATTVMFILVFVVLGVTAYFNMIQEYTPKIDFPLVTVDLVYPGASPIDIESQMVKKVEDEVSEVSDIKNIDSYIYENFARIVIEFTLESDADLKSMEVKDKVEAITNEFPSAAEKPIITTYDPLATPAIDIVLQSSKHNPIELYEYADKTLKNKFSIISGVASVDVKGGRERQINILLDNNLMLESYTSIDDVINTIQAENINIPGGNIEKSKFKTSLRFVGEFQSPEEIKNLSITSREGKVLKLSDIATIEDGSKKLESMAKFNGDDSVILSLIKLSEGSTVNIVRDVVRNIETIQAGLPEGMRISVATEQATIVTDENQSTVENIVIGIILTIIILLVFLGDWRAAVISALVIPSSIISSLFLMDASDFSFNVMTLLAFGTCLGTLIANALVVIESVYAHLAKGKDPESAAIDGTKEVLLSVIAAAGTNLVVFTPIAFMGGIVGKFFVQFGVTVVFATIFSIIASISLTPMLCAKLLKPESEMKKSGVLFKISSGIDSLLAKMYGLFRGPYETLVKHPIKLTALMTMIFIISFWPAKYIGFEFVPSSDDNKVEVEITMPEGTNIHTTNKFVTIMENRIKEIPEVRSFVSDLGENGEENATITADLLKRNERTRSDLELIDELMLFAADIPEAEIVVRRGSAFADDGSGDVQLEIYGNIDYDKLIEISKDARKIMRDSGYFGPIRSSYKTPKDEIKFIGDTQKMIDQGIKNATLGMTLRNIVNGNDVNVYKENGEEYDIMVQVMDEQAEDISDFKQFATWGRDGLISIESLGDMEEVKAIPPMRRINKLRTIVLDGWLVKGTLAQVQNELSKDLRKIKFPLGAGYKYGGDSENMEESSQEIGKAFLLAIILTYMLLVALLNSYTLPIAIGTTIVTSYAGSILFLFFTGLSMNVISMMAIVMLVGLTVNNAILIADYALQQIDKGVNYSEALWLGITAKTKTVMMTSIAIIAGTFPQFLDPVAMKASMGAVIIGGIIGSLFFTYTIVPPTFVLCYKYRGTGKRLKEKLENKRLRLKAKKCNK